MDVNEGNHDLDDTIDSIDGVGVGNSREVNRNVEEINGNVPEPMAYPVENTDGSPAKPLLKDARTGKFIKGTGGSGKGGRPQGSRDKISRKLVDLCTELVADKGSEMLDHLSRTDPAAAMAICLKVVPPEEMRRVFNDDLDTTKDAIQQITISLVGKPTEQRIEPPKPRLERASEDDIAQAIPQYQTEDIVPDSAPEARPETPSEPTQEELERERVARQNETLRMYGGLTGTPSRAQRKGNGIDYPDDYNI